MLNVQDAPLAAIVAKVDRERHIATVDELIKLWGLTVYDLACFEDHECDRCDC